MLTFKKREVKKSGRKKLEKKNTYLPEDRKKSQTDLKQAKRNVEKFCFLAQIVNKNM